MKRICQAMTCKEFAAFYGYHPTAVTQMCRDGKLNAERHGKQWIIYDEFNVSTTTATVFPVGLAISILSWVEINFPMRIRKRAQGLKKKTTVDS